MRTRLAAAITAYDEVLARDPEYDEPHFDRAVAHKGCGDLDAGRRAAVTSADGRLLGLLCLKASRAGFCSDLDVRARALGEVSAGQRPRLVQPEIVNEPLRPLPDPTAAMR